MTKTHLYDLLFIIDATLDETARQRLANDIRSVITSNGGQINKDTTWGVRKLAYEIQKKTEGLFINIEFSGSTEIPKLINEFIKTHQGILRHLTIQVPKAKLEQDRRDQERLQKQLAQADTERRAARRESVPSGEQPEQSQEEPPQRGPDTAPATESTTESEEPVAEAEAQATTPEQIVEEQKEATEAEVKEENRE
ncbi:MAG: 30S ribosomal protein S6 [bacterium]|jgi:small subunit ribosomal protein S6